MMYSLTLHYWARLASEDDYGIPNVSPITTNWYRNSLSSLERFVGEELNQHNVTSRCLYEWQLDIEKSVAVVTANTYKRGVRSVLNKLAHKKILPDGLTGVIRMKPEPPKSAKAITKEKYELMLVRADIKWRAAIAIMWDSGIRRGGLVSICHDTLEIRIADNGEYQASFWVMEKGERPRQAFAKDFAAGLLRDWIAFKGNENGHVFNGRYGGQMSVHTVNSMFRKIGNLAKIEKPFNPHAFRHAFALRKLDEGHSPDRVAAWMGIRVQTMLENYCIHNQEELRRLFFE